MGGEWLLKVLGWGEGCSVVEKQECQGCRASQSWHAKRAGVSLLCSNIFTDTNEKLFQSNTSRSLLVLISIQQMWHIGS